MLDIVQKGTETKELFPGCKDHTMKASGDGPINDAKWAKWIEWTEQNKISWVLWSASDKNETCSVLNDSANKNGQWTDKDLKESGIKARALKKSTTSISS